jgi:hypothetical protein
MNYKNIDGWIYITKEDKKFSIIPPRNVRKSKPKTLFKYYPLNEKSINALVEFNIYASNPIQLNDPYDICPSLIKFDNEESIRNIFKPLKRDKEIENILNKDPYKLKNEASWHFLLQLYSKIGILCLSESPNNMLMWGYYNKHKGFCIEYDYNQFDFEYLGPFQMNYRDKFTPISINNGADMCFLYSCNLKSKVWSHEKEWRLFPIKANMEIKEEYYCRQLEGTNNRLFKIGKDSIKKIIIGHNFFDDMDIKNHRENGKINVKLRKGEELRNKIIDWIIINNINCEIVFSKIDSFKLVSLPIEIERINEFELNIEVNNNGA